MKTILAVLVAIALTCSNAFAGDGITRSQVRHLLRLGMDMEDVQEILGSPDNCDGGEFGGATNVCSYLNGDVVCRFERGKLAHVINLLTE